MTSTYSERARELLRRHSAEVRDVLEKYGASNPRSFGSVARGTAGPDSDIDILIDLRGPGSGSRLARLSGIRLELEQLLHARVDVASEELLKDGIAEAARRQVIAL